MENIFRMPTIQFLTKSLLRNLCTSLAIFRKQLFLKTIGNYCSIIWGTCGKTNLDYLDKLQLRAAKIIEQRKIELHELKHIFSWPCMM